MHEETDWKDVNKRFQKFFNVPKFAMGKNYLVVDQHDNEKVYGIIVYYNSYWAEMQIDNNFRVFSFSNHKFVLIYD